MMLERDGYPHGVPCWLDTEQADPKAAADFYAGLLDWQCEDQMPPGAPGSYFMARLHGRDVAAIGSRDDHAPSGPAWNMYVSVGSADDAVRRVEEAGGRVILKPFDVFDSGRMAVFADPAGAVLRVWEAGTHRGAQVVNEPGTWNFNELATTDPEAAEAFYGTVFGWEATRTEGPPGGTWMWRVPGYGDFLEQLQPGIRRRHEEFGAPSGFTDAVAWMSQLDREESAAGVRWSTTFTVEDAVATVDRARRLGGSVVTEVVDVGIAQVAVLADPQGAVFTASQFTPENA